MLEISESMNVCLIPLSVLECHECVLDANVSVLDHEGVLSRSCAPCARILLLYTVIS